MRVDLTRSMTHADGERQINAPAGDRSLKPYARLALAVLFQAITDATAPEAPALRFGFDAAVGVEEEEDADRQSRKVYDRRARLRRTDEGRAEARWFMTHDNPMLHFWLALAGIQPGTWRHYIKGVHSEQDWLALRARLDAVLNGTTEEVKEEDPWQDVVNL